MSYGTLRGLCLWCFALLSYVLGVQVVSAGSYVVRVTFPCDTNLASHPLILTNWQVANGTGSTDSGTSCGSATQGGLGPGQLNGFYTNGSVVSLADNLTFNGCYDSTVSLMQDGQILSTWTTGHLHGSDDIIQDFTYRCQGAPQQTTYTICETVTNFDSGCNTYTFWQPFNVPVGHSLFLCPGAVGTVCVTVLDTNNLFFSKECTQFSLFAPGSAQGGGISSSGVIPCGTIVSNFSFQKNFYTGGAPSGQTGQATNVTTTVDASGSVYSSGTNGGINFSSSSTNPLDATTFKIGANAIYDAVAKLGAEQSQSDLIRQGQLSTMISNQIVGNSMLSSATGYLASIAAKSNAVFVSNNITITNFFTNAGGLSNDIFTNVDTNVFSKIPGMSGFTASSGGQSVAGGLWGQYGSAVDGGLSNALIAKIPTSVDNPPAASSMLQFSIDIPYYRSLAFNIDPASNSGVAAIAVKIKDCFTFMINIVFFFAICREVRQYITAHYFQAAHPQVPVQIATFGGDGGWTAAPVFVAVIMIAIGTVPVFVVGWLGSHSSFFDLTVNPFVGSASGVVGCAMYLLGYFFPVTYFFTAVFALMLFKVGIGTVFLFSRTIVAALVR